MNSHPPKTKHPVARISKINGIETLVVDGRPFLLVGAQCDVWRSTKQDAKASEFFEGYREMNATAVSVGIPWSKIENTEDKYDFQFLDWFIRKAESNGLKLVVNLFNTNVCGKVGEGVGSSVYPGYTPDYILKAPQKYHRMVLPYPYKYVDAGPPMCPNDPMTLERERRLVTRVAEHLRDTDLHRTVIMMQLDNEFYYQQWDGKRPADGSAEELAIRCQCTNCMTKWRSGSYENGEEFMFKSFADYVRVLTDSITRVYPIPLYVNSPWWPPRVIPIFLTRCPNLAFVGIDGILSPREPNWLSRSLLDRNIALAAENPTENSEVRLNLDVLPYYTIIGQQGLGNLLWECHPPFTVVDDPVAKQRYADALYPLKWARAPIARARGTERLVGWYAIRDIRAGLSTDVFGNFVPRKADESPVEADRWFVREGASTRTGSSGKFTLHLGTLSLEVSGSDAGIVVRTGPKDLFLALPKGRIAIGGIAKVHAERGRFDGDTWKPGGPATVVEQNGLTVVETDHPAVIRLTFEETVR
ncbi:MAG: beta-galactosidase [Fimbriimonas sp.]|nr:beta-galactosidase [Fimbriimonas sp.]